MDSSLEKPTGTPVHGTTPPDSDADLIKRARCGDANAYGTLYERHAEAAARLARQITGNRADADDVVAESFARVLSAMRNGNGPDEAFRPYLLTALRRVAFDHVRGQRRQIPTEEADLPDDGEPFTDPVIADLDRSLVAQAFRSLPERWSAVLWHTEIEEASPAEVATMLGMSANGVAALRYRAREGLRQAYLQLHLSGRAQATCVPFAEKLPSYVRGKLSRRQAREVAAHLDQCQECSAACADLTAINAGLRGVLAPVILGWAASGYLAASGHAGATVSTALASIRVAFSRFVSFLGHRPAVPITALAAAAAIAVPTFALVHAPREHLDAVPPTAIARTHQAQRGGAPVTGPTPASAQRPSPSEFQSPGPSPGTTATPHPSQPPSRSPHPHPSSTVPTSPTPTSPAPTSPASPSSSSSPAPTATVKVTAKLNVGVQVSGLLNLGVTVLVTVNVSDPGNGATGPLTATVDLPAGITLLGLSGSSSWSCGGGSPMTCTGPAVTAGGTANLSFNVLVLTLSGCGESVAATVASGALSASGSSAEQVACTPLL
jgi:RNA polymerase sigma factor (sigma-70 family)